MAPNTFTQTVVHEMGRMYPLALADSSWDNVGLLLENTEPVDETARRYRVLLTNDLTPDVVDEAITYGVTVIVSYHPVIFRGLKSITLADSQQASLIRLMQHNIAVYSPHTALDAAAGGINDWLAGAVRKAAMQRSFVTNIKDLKTPPPAPYMPRNAQGSPAITGYGRLVVFDEAVRAHDMIERTVRGLGLAMRHVLVARPRTSLPERDAIYSVAVCAGSGFDLLKTLSLREASMLITGEVSHHDALYATTRGQWVVCLLHSNSERQFLAAVLRDQLAKAITEYGKYQHAAVLVSEADRDPFEIWDLDNPPVKGR